MAIAPTGDIFKTLEFDGESSKSYGVYITGEAVYNAPEKDVEMISIPGRNGSFALDKGRFENIDVKYPAGIFATNEGDFASAISDFRNYLCSKKGYCRLTDDYNPDEYRLAIYKSGLEVSPAQLKAGQFEIIFDCKPQRYLMSGESQINLTSGETILNPTLFEAKPLIEIEGYGTIAFNGYEIELEDGAYGTIELVEGQTIEQENTDNPFVVSFTFDTTFLEAGDVINAKNYNRSTDTTSVFKLNTSSTYRLAEYYTEFTYANTNILQSQMYGGISATGDKYLRIMVASDGATFNFGTASTLVATSVVSDPIYDKSTGTPTGETVDLTVSITIDYDGDDTLTYTINRSVSNDPYNMVSGLANYEWPDDRNDVTVRRVYADSTGTYLGHPTYIDCEFGEAYKVENDTYISLNGYIDLGSELPQLAPGTNTFTYDNTVTDLKITPRWWKL